MADPDCFELEGIWLALYCIATACFLRWYLSPSTSLADTSSPAAAIDSDTETMRSSMSSPSKPRPPPKYIYLRDMAHNMEVPQTILGSTQRYHPLPSYPYPFPIRSGGDPRKPLVADGHQPPMRKPSDDSSKPSMVQGRRWKTWSDAAAPAAPAPPASPPCTPEEYDASLARLSAALRSSPYEPFLPSQSFRDVFRKREPAPFVFPKIGPLSQPLDLKVYATNPLSDPSCYPLLRPRTNYQASGRYAYERAVLPSPLVSLAPYSRPVQQPARRIFL